MNGMIVASFSEGGCVCLAVRVEEPNGEIVEYIGRVPVTELEGENAAEQKARLVAAVKASRDAQAASSQPGPVMTGPVTI